jgi:Zn-dependent metalloprotease
MIVRLVFFFLCIWVSAEIGFSQRVFADPEMQPGINHKSGFHGKNMMLPSDAIIRRDVNNDTIIFLRGKNLSAGLEEDKHFRELQTRNLPDQIALAFLTAHRSDFRLIRPSDEMMVSSVDIDNLGLTHVRLQQVFKGIRVWACEMIIHLDRANHVYLMQGRYIPTPVDVATCPGLNEAEVFRIVAENLKNVGTDCRRCRAELVIFARSEDKPRLAYRVLADPSIIEGYAYVIDAETGDILEKVPTVYNNGIFQIQMKSKRTD